MRNAIDINYKTGMFNSLTRMMFQKAAPNTPFGAMLESIDAQVTDTVTISATGAAEAVSHDDMTMEEYKQSMTVSH